MNKSTKLALSAILLAILAAAATLGLGYFALTEQSYGYFYIATGFIAPTFALFLAVLSIRARKRSGEEGNLPVIAVGITGLVFGFFTLWVIASMLIQGLTQGTVPA